MSDNTQLDQLDTMSDDELSKLDLESLMSEGTSETEETPSSEEQDKPTEEDDSQESTNTQAEEEVDYKAFYERMRQPFKANGKDYSIASADEAVQLMQMGANYHKKMQSIKPHTKLIKTLEKNGLTDENELAYLLDLRNKNPEAIAKLLKESELDTFEIEDKYNENYAPSVPQVTEGELLLEEILDSIRDTPSYERTLTVAGSQWDETSRQEIANNPTILRGLNDHIYSGIYDVIATEVERQRMLGNLQGVNDITAYKQVGDWLNSQGVFNAPNQQQQQVPPQHNQAEDQRNQRRASASAPNTGSAPQQSTTFDPAKLSDEEVLKLLAKY